MASEIITLGIGGGNVLEHFVLTGLNAIGGSVVFGNTPACVMAIKTDGNFVTIEPDDNFQNIESGKNFISLTKGGYRYE